MDQDQSSQSHERPVDAERAQTTLRTMNDRELAELHAQGPEALKPGAWEIVDQEIKRRARVKVRQASGARFMEEHDEENRYPALRAIVFLLKAIAVVALLIAVIGAVSSVRETRAAGGAGLVVALSLMVAGVILAITYWAAAELLVLLMDIEQNTRSMRRE